MYLQMEGKVGMAAILVKELIFFFHGGDPSITIDKNGTFVTTIKGTLSFQGIYSHYSNDNGLKWSNQKTISTDDIERATTATDIDANSIYYGRIYSCWAKLFPPYSIGFSYSNDGAQNWTSPTALSTVNLRRAGGEIAIGALQLDQIMKFTFAGLA